MTKTKKTEEKQTNNGVFVEATTNISILHLNLFLKKGEKISVTAEQLLQIEPQLESGVLKRV